jgi:DNA-binding transcriptional LysR family regulator
MSVELRHLRALVAVAESGAIARAAQALDIAASALSVTLGQLERELGVALLERHRGGVALTDEGRIAAAEAREAIAAFDRSVAGARRRARTGEIRLGMMPYMLSEASKLFAAFGEREPDIRLSVRRLDFATQLSELRAGRLDAELLVWEPQDADLELCRVGTYDTYVQLSADHPLAGRTSLRFAEIADEPWVDRHPSVPKGFVEHFWMVRRRGGRPPRLINEQPLGPDELWPLVAAGRTICTLPSYLVELARTMSGVVTIRLEDGDESLIALARRRGDPSPLVEALFRAARESPLPRRGPAAHPACVQETSS